MDIATRSACSAGPRSAAVSPNAAPTPRMASTPAPVSAAAINSSVRVAEGNSVIWARKLSCTRRVTGSGPTSCIGSACPARSAVRRAMPSSMSANGLPADSASTRSRPGTVSPGARSASNRRAAGRGRPLRRSVSMPGVANGEAVSRTANTTAIESAWKRRVANSSASEELRSSHCASSTRTRVGVSAASSASSVRVAAPTRKRFASGASICPNAARSAASCGPGSPPSRSR